MVALSPVSHRTPEAVARRHSPIAGAEGGFSRTLAALSDEDDSDAATSRAITKQRQDDADDGKTLPDDDADPAAATIDPQLIWLPGGMLAQTPQPAAPALPAGRFGAARLAGQVNTSPPIIAQQKAVQSGLGGPDVADAAGQARLTDLFKAAQHLAAAQAGAAQADGANSAAQLQPRLQQSEPTAVATLAAPLSSELAATLQGGGPVARDDRKKILGDPAISGTTMTTEMALQNAVQPTDDTKHVPLDLRDDNGLQRMIDRIETLRDDAYARDTRIRLVPDALGAVDVAVRRSGDALHVHFSAENAATRALIADAQPRLLELADARGVRIAGASVDSGASGGGQHARPRSQSAVAPISPTPTTELRGDDGRLA